MIQQLEKLEKSIIERIRLCERIAGRDDPYETTIPPPSPSPLIISPCSPPQRLQHAPLHSITPPRPPPSIPIITISPPSPRFIATPMPIRTTENSPPGPATEQHNSADQIFEQLLRERITRCEEIGAAISELSNCPSLTQTMTPKDALITLALGPPRCVNVSIGLSGGVRLGS